MKGDHNPFYPSFHAAVCFVHKKMNVISEEWLLIL